MDKWDGQNLWKFPSVLTASVFLDRNQDHQLRIRMRGGGDEDLRREKKVWNSRIEKIEQ